MKMTREGKDRKWLLLIVFVALGAALWIQAPKIADEYRINEDFRTFYWMSRFQDPSLFADDPIRRSLKHSYSNVSLLGREVPVFAHSLGFEMLYLVFSPVVRPLLFSKLLPFLLLPATALYLYRLGKSWRNRGTGLVLALAFVIVNPTLSSELSVFTGLQRSFALTLSFAFLYHLHERQNIASALAILAAALVYPPVFVIAAITWSLSLACAAWKSKGLDGALKKQARTMIMAFLVCGLCLSPALAVHFADLAEDRAQQQLQSPTIGTPIDVESDSRYGPGGRTDLFTAFPFVGRGGVTTTTWDALILALLFSMGCAVYLLIGRGRARMPIEIWLVLIASTISYGLAWCAFWLTNSFPLHLPSRYTLIGLFVFLFAFSFLNATRAVNKVALLTRQNPRARLYVLGVAELFIMGLLFFYPSERMKLAGLDLRTALIGLAVIVPAIGLIAYREIPHRADCHSPYRAPHIAAKISLIALAGLFLIGWGLGVRKLDSTHALDPSTNERELLDFVASLPKDALLAGTPCALDSIPTFSERQVLFSCEKLSRNPQVIRDALDAYYQAEPSRIVEFCDHYNIEYLVVDLRTYSAVFLDSRQLFFEPYNQEILAIIDQRDRFVLANVPDTIKKFRNQDYYVIACRDLVD